MTLELKPLGNSCNINCVYCYQEPMRNAGNARASARYDLDLMMDMADESGAVEGGYTVFGGEGLLIPKKDLERIFKRSLIKYGRSSIQTNGTLIDDDHIKLFKKYNVYVGLSCDGLGDLNELRESKTSESTLELTNKTIEAIKKLSINKIGAGIIITVHKSNGTKEKLPRLLEFVRWLGDMGLNYGIFHMLEVDSIEADKHKLSPEENTYAFLEILKFLKKEENSDLKYAPFTDMERLIQGINNNMSCVWSSCNAPNTSAVYGIEGNGQLSNCGMVNKDGIEWTKDTRDQVYFRDLVLAQTPQEYGGCKGCDYFILCNGYCNGSAIDNDWRNRTVHCETIKELFRYYETEMEGEGKLPFSKRADRGQLLSIYIDNLLKGRRLFINELLEISTNNKITVEVRGKGK